jgi:cytochrome c peroxidase
MPERRRAADVLAAIIGALGGFSLIAALFARAPPAPGRPIEDVRMTFSRPTSVPHPPDNVPTPERITLGARLFEDPRLSANGRIACATCHNPQLGYADGQSLSRSGATGVELRRHAPALWNLAWAPALYWDGRAASLEDQARFPLSHPDEMASTPEDAARRLGEDPGMVAAFARAFPGTRTITGAQVLEAIAAFERTLVSPPTAFDRWIAGDDGALADDAKRGFQLFTGRAGCVRCHSGFAFTDHAFHDIGLPGNDPGRGAIIGLEATNQAFKTPGLRELAWTAPYMHDGSLRTLEDVIRHYESGGIVRPSRSRDMPARLALTEEERSDLVAFLDSLSSDRPPAPSREAWVGRPETPVAVAPASTRRVSQRNKAFAPSAIRVRRGDTITILNDDSRTHNVRIVSPTLSFNSGAQDPGENVSLRLDLPGRFEAHCGIHPTMRLSIEVE